MIKNNKTRASIGNKDENFSGSAKDGLKSKTAGGEAVEGVGSRWLLGRRGGLGHRSYGEEEGLKRE